MSKIVSIHSFRRGTGKSNLAANLVAILAQTGKRVAILSGGIYLVPSSVKPGDIARILGEGYDVNLRSEGLRELIRHLNLDYVFIDTYPGLDQETLPFMATSDILIVILCPDRQDYQGTAVTVDVAKKLEAPRVYLVVNKVLPVFDT